MYIYIHIQIVSFVVNLVECLNCFCRLLRKSYGGERGSGSDTYTCEDRMKMDGHMMKHCDIIANPKAQQIFCSKR